MVEGRPDLTFDSRSDEPRDDGAALFRSVYESHYGAIYRYVRRRLATDRSEVPDVTAEVFVVAWKRRKNLPGPPEDLLWLYGVARNVVSRHRRGLERRHRLRTRLAGLAPPPVILETADERDRVRQAIDRLRPAEREALLLVMWEDLTYAQAARVLSCSQNAVTIRVHRAKRKLGLLLGGNGHEPDVWEGGS